MEFPKGSFESLQYLSTSVGSSRSTRFLANFSTGMIGKEAGPLLKWVDLSRKTNQQTLILWHIKKRYLQLFCWKIKNSNLIKNYEKTNPTVFVFSVWEKCRWGLTSFGQFRSRMNRIYLRYERIRCTRESQPESKQVMPETRFTEFPVLCVDPKIGISRFVWD